MKILTKKASTDVTVYVFVQASNVTTGAGLIGLTFETASLVASYVRPGAARAAITLATQTVDGEHSDGGFVEVDATNMPGVYRLDLPDAVCATGVGSVVVMLKGAANMAPVLLEIQLLTQDPNDIATQTTAAAIIADTGTDGVIVASLANDSITAAALKADAITEIQTGLATPTNITAGVITTVTNLTNLPAVTTDWLTAAGVKADAVTKIGTGVWASATRTLTQSAASVAAVLAGSDITIQRGDTETISLTDIGALTGYTKLWFTVKGKKSQADSASLLQIEIAGGLLYLNGAAASTATDGSITISDQATGDISIVIKAAATAVLEPGAYHYDIQMLTASGVTTLTYGTFTIEGDVTRAVA